MCVAFLNERTNNIYHIPYTTPKVGNPLIKPNTFEINWGFVGWPFALFDLPLCQYYKKGCEEKKNSNSSPKFHHIGHFRHIGSVTTTPNFRHIGHFRHIGSATSAQISVTSAISVASVPSHRQNFRHIGHLQHMCRNFWPISLLFYIEITVTSVISVTSVLCITFAKRAHLVIR